MHEYLNTPSESKRGVPETVWNQRSGSRLLSFFTKFLYIPGTCYRTFVKEPFLAPSSVLEVFCFLSAFQNSNINTSNAMVFFVSHKELPESRTTTGKLRF